MNLYPFVFKPNNKKLVWGTEEWAISAVPGSESIVANGPLEGKSLSKVIESAPEAILGREVYAKYGAMPLLAKIIEAKADLSIQVHPNDQMARRLHNKMGKSFCPFRACCFWKLLSLQPVLKPLAKVLLYDITNKSSFYFLSTSIFASPGR